MNKENEPQNPSAGRDPLLLDHDYDGIQELDNKLPRWWVWLFNLCILFAAAYLIYYHVLSAGDLMASQYTKEMKVGNALKALALEGFEKDIGTIEPSKDQLLITKGRQIFKTSCAPCHADDGGGIVGPNLCDDYWIHGSKFSDNVRTIWNGVPEKGMITWKNYLKPQEILEVASYIYTLRGTHPAHPKPPENQAPVKTGPSEFE
jgi:cytochrome c oxidase cbb3-type subunit 3